VPLWAARASQPLGAARTQILEAIAETARDVSTRAGRLRYSAPARRGLRGKKEVRKPFMVVAATASQSAVLFLFVLSFLCFMSGAALRRWPDRVQAYMERVDGSLWFVSAASHRALIGATGIALTVLSILALLAARLIA
jgi:hypothetical protein